MSLNPIQTEQNNYDLQYPSSEQIEMSDCSVSDYWEEDGCLRHIVSRSRKGNLSLSLAKWCIPFCNSLPDELQHYIVFNPITPPSRSILCIYRI